LNRIIFILCLFWGLPGVAKLPFPIVQVSEGIFRSPMPVNENEWAAIKKLGPKTILSLVTDSDYIEMEKKWAEKNGIIYISRPLSPSSSPDMAL